MGNIPENKPAGSFGGCCSLLRAAYAGVPPSLWPCPPTELPRTNLSVPHRFAVISVGELQLVVVHACVQRLGVVAAADFCFLGEVEVAAVLACQLLF